MSSGDPSVRSGAAYGCFLLLAGLLTLAGVQGIQISRADRTGDPGPRAYPTALALVLIGGGVTLLSANWFRRHSANAAVRRPATGTIPAASASRPPPADRQSADAAPAWPAPGDTNERERDRNGYRRRGWIVAGAVALYAVLLPWTGFVLTTAGFAVVMVRQLRGSWATAAGVGVSLPALVYLLFVRLFQVQLPTAGWLPF